MGFFQAIKIIGLVINFKLDINKTVLFASQFGSDAAKETKRVLQKMETDKDGKISTIEVGKYLAKKIG